MSAELEKACTSGERRSDRRKRFPLGLGDGWTDSEGDGDNETVTQVPKKKRLCLSRNKKQSSGPTSEKENFPTSSRWRFLSEVEQDSLAKKCVPKNTATMTKWAVTNFLAWQTGRNKMFDGDQAKQVPTTLLQSTAPSMAVHTDQE